MIAFVTLAQAKAQLYLLEDETADDALLNGLIAAASGAVKRYLKTASPFQPVLDSNYDAEVDSNGAVVYELDSNGDKIVLPEVEQATLLLIGYFYKNRDDNPDSAFDRGYLPAPVTALLYPLRTPTVA